MWGRVGKPRLISDSYYPAYSLGLRALVMASATRLFTDGWRAYRRLPELGYGHKWVDHGKMYVCPTDKNLHTNRIEGLWNKFKRWLPQAGNYNLEEYVYIFMWTEEQ